MITRLRYPKGYQFFNSNGAPLALGCLYYYIAGSTTPQDTYSDSAGVIPNTNPVVLDGSGRLQGDVYLGSTADYKEVLLAYGVTVAPWPDDNIERATPIAVFTGDSGLGGNAGLVPAPGAGDALANKFLKADGTWAATPGGGGSGVTNLSVTETATAVSIASSSGSGATIPAATSSLAGVLDGARAAKIDGLATVATSGSYADLSNKPTIPAAQVNSDWNAGSGVAEILNKPMLATVATSGSYTDLSSKPAIPAASGSTPAMDGTAAAGSSANYARADHVHPTDTSRAENTAFTGDSGSGGTVGLVPAPAAGRAAAGAYLKADGTWTVPSGGGGGSPGGSSGQIQWNNGGAFAGFTASGDATINTATGVVTVTKINGSTPATVATSGSYNDLSNKPTTMTPSAHAATHANGGGDAISIAASQVSGIPASLASQNIDNVARVGIGTTDAGNKLSVAGSSVLFANSSGDIRTTLSKNAVGSTASFVFQDNFSGRAEFGLCGNDSFTMKVSPDGAAWNNGIVISTAGVCSFPNTSLVFTNATATLTAGYAATSYSLGTLSSGTTTLSAANGNVQHATNGGAFTLAPQSSPSTIALEIVNNASAGAITTSGYTKVVGSFVTTNAAKFQCISCVTNSASALYITQVV